ncbi:MAG: hypothetical protein MR711_12650 [Selenomonas sp.]|jgi:hypothetical protein|uniref:hypothetical protein n=1 Tax=Selenomonas sp. TaxID=2053611 RepID=UPI0025DCF0DC|nr:hypothetical protein [Selenomonas sp.]MCI6087066.1 hypothetical protein [Selenomonas sp.]MDY4415187.1 hypothetical protein [Selenomonas sp.]
MSDMLEGYVPTGHRVFRGKKRIESEWMPTEMKPFVVRQPGDEDDATDDEKKAKAAAMDADDAAEDEAADGGSPEDIAARIAGDRVQFQADILAVARAEAGEDEDGNVIDAPADAAADDDAAEQEDAE